MGLLFNQFANLSIYHIWKIQASNFGLVSYLKCLGTCQLEFEMVDLYKNKGEIYLITGFILPSDWCIYM